MRIFNRFSGCSLYLWYMGIHIGQKIKEELYAQGISVTVFAKQINRSRNVAYNIFERESIDTALLNKISQTLNCDFFSMFSAQRDFHGKAMKQYHDPQETYHKQSEELEQLKQHHHMLAMEVEYLKKIVRLLETGKGQGEQP